MKSLFGWSSQTRINNRLKKDNINDMCEVVTSTSSNMVFNRSWHHTDNTDWKRMTKDQELGIHKYSYVCLLVA